MLELGLEETLLLLPRGEQRVANVRKFLSMADRERDARALLRRLDWADRVSREPEAAVFSEDDDAVRLLTIHASKGLDFRVVVIPEVGSAASNQSNLPLLLTSSSASPPVLAAKAMGTDGRTHDFRAIARRWPRSADGPWPSVIACCTWR